MPSWDDFVEWAIEQAGEVVGRKALRRRWAELRKLAEQVSKEVDPNEIRELLGKSYEELDPENNDLKALVAYGAGKGIIAEPARLQAVLRDDTRADPLHFLSRHSGKTFGEKYAPLFAKFWLVLEQDGWMKQKSTELYDIGWVPHERRGKEIRIEIKASSEHPSYRFQQIRHPELSGSGSQDYDLLLCVGVSAGTLEWWAVPASELEQYADTGTVPPEQTVITRHHGKRRPIWNGQYGYADEGWFQTDSHARALLKNYACTSDQLRNRILSIL